MLTLKFISVGTLKEGYLREACAEYIKRLSGFAKVEQVNVKEARLSDSPSDAEIASALSSEAKEILQAAGERSYKVALCIEGKQFSSEVLAQKLDSVTQTHAEICFIIGSSFGLAPEVKQAADLRLSFSELTFPHQLMRVMLLEAVYRCMNITKGTKYHK